MSALATEPKIISMAHGLGIHAGDPVEGIKRFCREKVRRLIAGHQEIRSIEDVERIVCEKLNITIIEIWNDADLDAVIEKYARIGKDAAFAYLRKDLDFETFATLIRCRRKIGDDDDRYVAVVDCRGEKGSKRFFSRWHEIAHVLTLFEQLQFPLHRSTAKKDAVEKMMDIIAGDVGFFEPLFTPLLNDEVTAVGRITFDGIRQVRSRFCPSASLQATLNACAGKATVPVMHLEAAMRMKRAEERFVASGQGDLFPAAAPIPQLRVSTAASNAAARQIGLVVHPNMRIPSASVIARAFTADDEFLSFTAVEDMQTWTSSRGGHMTARPVMVEAMRVRDQVWAIVTPL